MSISEVGTKTTTRQNAKDKDVKNIELENINTIFSTEKLEKERSNFEETFNEENITDSPEGQKFLESLINNKERLCEELGLDEEQYDVLSCMALALASQETGMGKEKGINPTEWNPLDWEFGYTTENSGPLSWIRNMIKNNAAQTGGSASSGLTQVKINDFMNNGLSQNEIKLLESLGVITINSSEDPLGEDKRVTSKGSDKNNLDEESDKAAIATIVVLNHIAQGYDEYKEILENDHKTVGARLNDNLSEEERNQKGEDVLNSILHTYKTSTNAEKNEIRNTVKDWLISTDLSKEGDDVKDKYNEEINLNKLNELLAQNGFDGEIKAEDLDYVRYYLTSQDQELDIMEYCAYGWNKGALSENNINEKRGTNKQLDRVLADKIGTILKKPENYDYDQFTVNVVSLAEKYAQQSSIDIDSEYFNEAFEEYN